MFTATLFTSPKPETAQVSTTRRMGNKLQYIHIQQDTT